MDLDTTKVGLAAAGMMDVLNFDVDRFAEQGAEGYEVRECLVIAACTVHRGDGESETQYRVAGSANDHYVILGLLTAMQSYVERGVGA